MSEAPSTVEDVARENVASIAALERAARARQGWSDRIAGAIARFCGSMAFVFLHVAWYGIWLAWNTLPFVPGRFRFDPMPFAFLTLVVSLEAIFLSTFILISQNRQARLTERRAHLDLQVNLLGERENSKILEMLVALLRHHGLPEPDAETLALHVAARPEDVVRQIEEAIEKS